MLNRNTDKQPEIDIKKIKKDREKTVKSKKIVKK